MSYQHKTHLYRKRRFNDLFNDTLVFVFRNVLPITKVVLVFVGPMVILYGTVLGLVTYTMYSRFQGSFGQTPITQPEYMTYMASGLSITSFVLGGLTMVAFYLSINSFILRYGESTDGRVKLKEVWEDIKENIFHILGLVGLRGLGYFLLIGLTVWLLDVDSFIMDMGAFLLVLITTFLGVSTSLADVIRMNEGGSVFYALKTSFRLVNKQWWATFGLYLLLAIVNVLILMVVSAISSALIGSMGSNVVSIVIGSILSIFILVALYSSFLSLFWVAGALQYFNLSDAPGRASSTEDLIDQIGKTPDDSLF